MGNSQGKPVVFTDQVNLTHFRLLRVVGKGAFGKVRIVERKDSGCTFALKYIRKDEVVRSESVRNIIRERRMLEQLNHPFLCNLRYSFQDVEYLYLVVDLMTGGDLRFHIARKTFTEDAIRFWIAELGCALRYIHSQGIVHRDVKPDNVLLDGDGHVHLADFNVASDFRPDKPLTSKSGTLAYLAPEVYEGQGYSCQVDWWSLGVVFYECIFNKRPFEGSNHEQLARRVRQAEPAFPVTNPPVSNPCLHAISSLLEKDKRRRIGAAGFETFTDSPFFRVLDFVALENKEIEPIFKPSSEKTNFDATYDLEELLLEEAPLEARARRQKPREQLKHDATTAEIRADELHRMIETMFEPFDYTLASFDKNKASHDVPLLQVEQAAQTPPAVERQHGRLQTHQFGPPNGDLPRTPSHSRIDDRNRPFTGMEKARSGANTANATPSGSPPLPSIEYAHSSDRQPPRSTPNDYFAAPRDSSRHRPDSRGSSQVRRPYSRSRRPHDLNSRSSSIEATPEPLDLVEPPPFPEAFQQPRPGTPGDERGDKRPSGMLAFLSRKRGRDRSPKARERGVLGKEGARVIVGP